MIAKVRELKLHIMFGFLVVILLLGQAFPVMGQSSNIADHVVINEVDINPLGDDSKIVSEWVELYNPTNQTVDLGGWSIGATTGLKTIYKVTEGTKLESGDFITFAYGPLWFPDTSSIIQLKNKNATVVDETPILRDINNDLKSWQRTIDGLDTDSSNDWAFRTSNAGSSNGKATSSTTSESLSIKISTDKLIYIFGDAVKISGDVSKIVAMPHQTYTGQSIHLTLTGPEDFKKTLSLFPDRMNMFKTEMKTDKVLKIPEGDYKAVVEYGGQTAETTFSIFEKSFIAPQKAASTVISINVDKPAYLPGETAILSANTSKITPLAGMKFKIFDPDKKQIYDGSLYPDTKGKFSTKIFINSVKPVFGTYNVVATYGKETTTTSYELVPEIKENKLISLGTDKKAYGLGDTVIITGRSNKVWISSFNIEIVQSIASNDITDTFVVKDAVRVAGDSTFKYEFIIPNDSNRYGDYKVRVSEQLGSAETLFKVVQNPSEFVATESKPLTIMTDKPSYNIGDNLVISGTVLEKKDLGRQVVQISITKADGTPIISKGDPTAPPAKSKDSAYSFTGIPDSTGNFEIKSKIFRNIFENGKYLIKAKYGDDRASTSFVVGDSLDRSGGVKILANADKEVYGIGEVVKITGGVSTFTAQTSYTITMTDPDGKVTKGGVILDKGQFSWSWTVPSRATVYGIYKIKIGSDSQDTNVYFAVSKNPESETKLQPIQIDTDKDVYSTGDTVTVSGSVIKKASGTEGLVVNVKPEIVVKSEANKEIYKTIPDLSADGRFKASFKVVPSVFKTGQYKISAKYYDAKVQTVFKVDDKFRLGTDTPLVLLVETDKEKYLPGDTVKISGRTSKIISVFDVDVTVTKGTELISDVTAKFDSTGSFRSDYKIPQNANLGNYTVKADTDFDTTTTMFEVVSELPSETVTQSAGESPTETTPSETTEPATETKQPKLTSEKTSETVNRVTESSIPIILKEKNVENKTFVPTGFDGSLRVNVGDESAVNIKVISNDGTCLIGQDSDCKVTKSTREGSSLYKTVKIGDTNLKVRYSGAGVKLEKFTILSEDPNGMIPDGKWNVEIIKDNQVSRFYYKISYTSVE